jgi:hypothetical protein
MPNMSTSEEKFPVIAPEKIYAEVRAGIRETDSISFKLLGLVPLVSGTALISLVLQSRTLSSGLVILLALFASTITLGLFRWELRNVQTCSWLIKYADSLEAHALTAKGMGEMFRPRPKAPQRIGKTEAEKLIYAATIVAWLALPIGIGALPQLSYRIAYYVAAGVILIGAIVSLFARPHVRAIATLPSDRPLQPASGAGQSS